MINKIFKHKLFPRVLYKTSDGGKNSGVKAFFIIEWKILFSIALLKFNKGSRENYHNHAFNALTWWLKGRVIESKLDDNYNDINKEYRPSIIPKYTPRNNFHKIFACENTYAITFRSNWKNIWNEYNPKTKKLITLTHNRKIVN